MEALIEAATNENLTAEDWSLIIGICEQVDGYDAVCKGKGLQSGNRSVGKSKDAIAALIKRLGHKNVNVVLYSLTLANALVQNCGLILKQEVSSRPFLQQLTKLLSGPKTHVTVKNRILDLIQTWTESFRGESSLDYMQEVHKDLLMQGYKFPSVLPPTPKKMAISEKDREEEELQMAMAMSLSEAKSNVAKPKPVIPKAVLFKVKALYDFIPTEEGELKLSKGQVIDVIDNSTFADWWKGSCNGIVGIFPSNYVSKLDDGAQKVTQRIIPDESAELLQQLGSVQALKIAIQKADPLGHNPQENEALQREYQKIVDLIPNILKKANAQRKKQDELAHLHERFSTAIATYQGIMNSYTMQRNQGYQQTQMPFQTGQPQYFQHQ